MAGQGSLTDLDALSHEGNDQTDVQEEHLPSPKAAIRALLTLLLLVNLAASLYQLPLNRVVERRLCQEYYLGSGSPDISHDGSIPEELCKVDQIQQRLAWILGIMETAWIVGDFAMTIPLSFVAEKYGQQVVLWLNLVPRISMLFWAVIVGYFEQALPTKAIIAGPMLSFVGGDCVLNSITYSLAAGITDDYVLRATYFGWMGSISYVVALLGPALASASMTIMLWLPFWVGISLLVFAIPTISMLPDHASARNHSRRRSQQEQTLPLLSSPVLKAQETDMSPFRSTRHRCQILWSILASHPRNLGFLMVCFFLTSLASSDTKLLPQYISKRYHWTFASAGYLLSGKAVVNFTLLTFVIPKLLRSRHSTPLTVSSEGTSQDTATQTTGNTDRANFRYANLCLAISVLGALAIATSVEIWILFPSLLLYALGSALPVFTLSLLESPSVAPKSHFERKSTETHMFSIVMMVKTLGSLLGAPLMASLWVRGIAVGDAGLGMPYFVSSGCYALAIVVFSRIRIS